MFVEGLISVIIPIYNSEEHIEECIESVLNQSYKNFELILVDDGSQDNSLDICKKYQKKDDRIIVHSKVNTGVSDTRNLGLALSKGEYVSFIDSDD